MPVIDIPYNCTCGAFWPAIPCPYHTPAGTWFTPPLHTYTTSTLAAPSSLSDADVERIAEAVAAKLRPAKRRKKAG